MKTFVLALIALLAAIVIAAAQQPSSTIAAVRHGFAHPPDDSRIMMRWWWFGPAVTETELARELRLMKEAGIGGVEIQPVYPIALDDPEHDFKNLPYLSSDFLARLRFASEQARQLGLRVDITLGSGWPYGGPETPITHAAGRLRCERIVIPEGPSSLPLPDMENGESLIAVFLADGDRTHLGTKDMKRITEIRAGRIQIPAALEGPHVLLVFVSSRSGMQVKRASVGAEGFVLDHYDRAAIEQHLAKVGNTLMQAFGPHPPYAVFSDSLEVFASDWTPDLIQEFQKRRGYDLTPYLPALVADMGDVTASVRHDWGRTLTELADERYLTPIRDWAHAHHTLFRSQTYGVPPVILSSNTLVDLAEGEAGPKWRTFSTARWASSANHLYGRNVTSSETWTWLHSPAFRATPLDMKAEADLHFIEGINQLIGHGWPYSPPSVAEPGWRFYAAAAFNNHNPWFNVMPDLTTYLQRVSFLLRQGAPANDIAIYLPTDDAWAGFTAGKDSVDRSMDALLGPKLIPQVLNAGYNFDFIDDRAIATVGVPNRVLILPHVERIPLSTLQKLDAWVRKGGILVATRRLPSLAPGRMEANTDTAQIQALTKALFEGPNPRATLVQDEDTVPDTLNKLLPADVTTAPASTAVGFIHRKLSDGEIYFIVNTSNQPLKTQASFRVKELEPQLWDPFTGNASGLTCERSGDRTVIALDLNAYESRVVVFGRDQIPANRMPAASPGVAPLDLGSGWKVSFPREQSSEDMAQLHSWANEPKLRFYSGEAIYEKSVDVPPAFLSRSRSVALDFGEGKPLDPVNTSAPGMRAWMEGPVREAAVVYVNGQKAGYVWHPPYRIAVNQFLHPGLNQFRIVVGNSAINSLAGQAAPDYRLLNLRYGVRFTPQDMSALKPLPSGLVGPVHLIAE
jgi:hypothetical protein